MPADHQQVKSSVNDIVNVFTGCYIQRFALHRCFVLFSGVGHVCYNLSVYLWPLANVETSLDLAEFSEAFVLLTEHSTLWKASCRIAIRLTMFEAWLEYIERLATRCCIFVPTGTDHHVSNFADWTATC